MARAARSSVAGALVTATAGVVAAIAVGSVAATKVPPWALVWQLTVGLGCVLVGHVILDQQRRLATDTRSRRRASTGHLLTLAGVSLFVGPAMVVAGQPALARWLWLTALLVTIPLALLRVAPEPQLTTGFTDAAIIGAGLATATAGAAGLSLATVLLGLVSIVLVVVATAQRFGMTSGDERRRILWVILGLIFPVPFSLTAFVAAGTGGGIATVFMVSASLSALSLPLSAGVAALAPRIVDVRAVMERVTVAAIMFALAAAAYIGTESAIVTVTGHQPSRGLQVLIVVGIAAGFQPVKRWVRASVNEMLFGGRADPVAALTLLGNRLATGSSPSDWLDTLRVSLAAPGVAIRDGGKTIAASGDIENSPTVRVELRTGEARSGELVVALAADDPYLVRATEAILRLVSLPLAQAMHAAHLTEDLRESRGRAVTALEEERRRMRRDLHDGLGPRLTGIAYSADAVSNLLRSHPEEASEILQGLRAETREALAEIRRIVYGLRPRALDELGLVGAVRQQASRLRTADGRLLAVTFHAVEDVPVLPAAVEVAAYRMAVEALTNVARHAGVAEASATFEVTDGPALRVTVADRGRSATAWILGMGIASMRERVEQVGGTLSLCSGPEGATVTAEFPLAVARDAELNLSPPGPRQGA